MFNLAGFDLNLLVAFDALMTERHVSRAAERVGLSQPAMSNALRRLRDIFQDELFLRSGRSMVPTGVAVELDQTIGPALGRIRTGLQTGLHFDPKTTKRSFTLGFPDIASVGLLPQLSNLIRREAPEVNLEVIDIGAEGGIDLILSGRIDLAVGVSFSQHPEISQQFLGKFEYVVVIDKNNERSKKGQLTITDIAELPHVSFAPISDISEIDERLARHGLARRIAISVPHGLSVPRAVAGTDMIAFMDESVITVASDLGLAVLPDPLDLPRRRVDTIWHRRQDNDPGHMWLRHQVGSQVPSHRNTWGVQQSLARAAATAAMSEP